MTEQTPIHAGFGPASTAAEVIAGIDLTGKVAIVTGGYSGIGLETAKALAGAGATVIVPARDAAKAAERLAEHPEFERESLDLIDPASIDAFAKRFLASGRPLHLLVNNAGIMACPLRRDARGYESQFATNHFGHYQLTARLWPALKAARGARVVQLSSLAHARMATDFADWNFESHPYDEWEAYAQSKIANALFARSVDALGKGDGVRTFSVHPGAIVTDLGRDLPEGNLEAFGMVDADGQPIVDPAAGLKNVPQGAATSVWCATSPTLDGKGGVYCEDCDIAKAVPADAPHGPGARPWVMDDALAGKLWRITEAATRVAFP